MKRRLIISLIFFNFINEISLIAINRAYIENPLLYKNEICSFNGDPIVVGNNIECSCYSSYIDEPRESYKRYIGNQLVRCSYKKKKRFLTFFLASVLPMGFDYFYLGYYISFAVVFFCFFLLILSQICCFILSYKVKEINEETRFKYSVRNEKINNDFAFIAENKKGDKKEKLEKSFFFYYVINRVLLFVGILYWLVDVIIQAAGKVRDSNGVETENDFQTLLSKEEF